MFEVSFVVRSRSQQHDARIVAAVGRQRTQGIPQRTKEGSQALHVALAKNRWDRPRKRDPILQRITGAGGRLRAVAEHLEFALRACAPDRRRRDAASDSAAVCSVAGAKKAGIGPNQFRAEAARSKSFPSGHTGQPADGPAIWRAGSILRAPICHSAEGISSGIRSRFHGRSRPFGSP